MFHIRYIHELLDFVMRGKDKEKVAQVAAIFAVCVSSFLIVMKLIAWILTNSISLQASMNDSILDALASFVAFYAIRFSHSSSDDEHNFGHGKVEGIISFLQCLFIVASGCFIFYEAYARFFEEKGVVNSHIGVTVMLVSIILVYSLVYFQKYCIEKTDSMLLKGDNLHYLSDFFMNISVILSLLASNYFYYIDSICGVCVGCYVMYNAAVIMRNALVDLMDQSLPINEQMLIRELALKTPGVEAVATLRTRSAGMKKYVEIEVKLISSGSMSFIEATYITREIEKAIQKELDNIDVFVRGIV